MPSNARTQHAKGGAALESRTLACLDSGNREAIAIKRYGRVIEKVEAASLHKFQLTGSNTWPRRTHWHTERILHEER